MIPCRKNKCILLPVCRYKTNISCDELESYFVMLMRVRKFNFNKSFDVITETIPYLHRMEGNGRVFFNIQHDEGYEPEIEL